MIKVFKLLKVYFKYLNCSRQECRATYLDACIACLSKSCNQDVGCGYRHRDRFKDQLWKDVSLSSLTGLLTGSGFSGLVGLRASVPLWLVVRGFSQCLATWVSPQSSSLQNRWISSEQTSQRTKDSQQDKSHLLCNLIWKVTSHHLCWILLIRGESLRSGQ